MCTRRVNHGCAVQYGARTSAGHVAASLVKNATNLFTTENGGLQKFISLPQSDCAKASIPDVPYSRKYELNLGNSVFALVAKRSIVHCTSDYISSNIDYFSFHSSPKFARVNVSGALFKCVGIYWTITELWSDSNIACIRLSCSRISYLSE